MEYNIENITKLKADHTWKELGLINHEKQLGIIIGIISVCLINA